MHKLECMDTLFLLIIRQPQNRGDTYYIMRKALHALKWMDGLLRKGICETHKELCINVLGFQFGRLVVS